MMLQYQLASQQCYTINYLAQHDATSYHFYKFILMNSYTWFNLLNLVQPLIFINLIRGTKEVVKLRLQNLTTSKFLIKSGPRNDKVKIYKKNIV